MERGSSLQLLLQHPVSMEEHYGVFFCCVTIPSSSVEIEDSFHLHYYALCWMHCHSGEQQTTLPSALFTFGFFIASLILFKEARRKLRRRAIPFPFKPLSFLTVKINFILKPLESPFPAAAALRFRLTKRNNQITRSIRKGFLQSIPYYGRRNGTGCCFFAPPRLGYCFLN